MVSTRAGAGPSASASPPSSPRSSSTNRRMLGRLPTFDGSNVKSAAEVMRFLFQLGAFFTLNNIAAADRMGLVAGALAGAALDWLILVHDSIADFESFEKLLKKEFSPSDPTRAARAELWNCTQTGNLADYTSRFRTLAFQIHDLSPAERADRYMHGLKPLIRNQVIIHGETTFEAMTLLAARIDQALSLSSSHPASPANPTPVTNRPQSYRAAAIATSAAPATFPAVSAPVRIGPDRKGPLTPELRAACIAAGACFYCRYTGHTTPNCPDKPARPAPLQGNGLSQ